MSFFKKIQERIIPIQTSNSTPLLQRTEPVKHEFVNFSGAYRIGISSYFTDPESQELIKNYKHQIEQLGYECEVLLFVDKKEKDHAVYLQSFGWDDLERRSMLPHSPRTDRYMLKKFDLLLNLFLNNCPPLLYLSHMSGARCRVSPYLDHFTHCSDLMIPVSPQDNLEAWIKKINTTLILKPYERKPV